MNEFNNEELQKYFSVFLYMMSENKNALYFATPVIVGFKIVNGEIELKKLDYLLDSSVSAQMNCMKVLHKLSMLYAYVVSYMGENNLNFNSMSIDTNKKYSILLSIGNENINVVNYKGFGLFCSNTRAFGWGLNKSLDLLFNYVKKLSEKNEYLKRVVDYWSKYPSIDPDTTILRFIKNNQDFYKNELEQSKNLS